MPEVRNRSTLCAPNAIRHAGAPEFAAARLPSWRSKWMRLARHKIPLAWCHTDSNHSASVRACSNAMPLPWAASFAILFPTTYRSNGGFSHTRPSHGTDKPFCVRVLFAQSHGRGSAPAGSRSNVNGNVIGVNTAIFSPSGGSVGIGFDIPADTVKTVVAQLKDSGHVTRGWMGVQIQAVTADIADSLGLKKAEGALVSEPQVDSPAAKAGITSGDVITTMDGTDVKDSRMLARKIGAMAPGTSVKLGVLHNGSEKAVTLTLGTLPDERQANASPQSSDSATPRLGLTLAPANAVDAGNQGVAVTAVDPNGPAAERGMQSGNVILDVAGKGRCSAKL